MQASSRKIVISSLILLSIIMLTFSAPVVHAQSVVAYINVGSFPHGLAYDPSKGEIFVANNGLGGGNTVSVISDNTNAVVANITVGSGPLGVAYDSGKGEIFVTSGGNSTVSVISDASNTVVATIPVSIPQSIALRPREGRTIRVELRFRHGHRDLRQH